MRHERQKMEMRSLLPEYIHYLHQTMVVITGRKFQAWERVKLIRYVHASL